MSKVIGPECIECGAWICAPRVTLCQRCEDKINNYANAMIKRDQVRGYPYHPSMDLDVSGAPLYGPGSREAIHRQHIVQQKEEKE